jgi:hypothetical protein
MRKSKFEIVPLEIVFNFQIKITNINRLSQYVLDFDMYKY